MHASWCFIVYPGATFMYRIQQCFADWPHVSHVDSLKLLFVLNNKGLNPLTRSIARPA
jgi:hypothetical protein